MFSICTYMYIIHITSDFLNFSEKFYWQQGFFFWSISFPYRKQNVKVASWECPVTKCNCIQWHHGELDPSCLWISNINLAPHPFPGHHFKRPKITFTGHFPRCLQTVSTAANFYCVYINIYRNNCTFLVPNFSVTISIEYICVIYTSVWWYLWLYAIY